MGACRCVVVAGIPLVKAVVCIGVRKILGFVLCVCVAGGDGRRRVVNFTGDWDPEVVKEVVNTVNTCNKNKILVI